MPKRISVPSEPHHGSETPAAADVLARAPAKRGDWLWLIDAVGKVVIEKLQPLLEGMRQQEPLRQAILELTSELRRATGTTSGDSIDSRKMFIAGIIKSRPPIPKMSDVEILREADRLQELRLEKKHRRPVPDWGVRLWSDMKDDNRAQSYIAKIRAEPRYLPFEYLSKLGKKRFKMNPE